MGPRSAPLRRSGACSPAPPHGSARGCVSPSSERIPSGGTIRFGGPSSTGRIAVLAGYSSGSSFAGPFSRHSRRRGAPAEHAPARCKPEPSPDAGQSSPGAPIRSEDPDLALRTDCEIEDPSRRLRRGSVDGVRHVWLFVMAPKPGHGGESRPQEVVSPAHPGKASRSRTEESREEPSGGDTTCQRSDRSEVVSQLEATGPGRRAPRDRWRLPSLHVASPRRDRSHAP